jgi:hypothetical protein
MIENLHIRAQQLIAQHGVEGISNDEQAWLSAHLAECDSCSALHAQTAAAISSFRTMNIEVPKNLAARTQLRVRLRAEELGEHNPGRKLLWGLVAVSWMLGVATAPFVWRAFSWIGGEIGLPKVAVLLGMALWWLVPGLLITGAVVVQKEKAERGAE